jgi:hypothetical protein
MTRPYTTSPDQPLGPPVVIEVQRVAGSRPHHAQELVEIEPVAHAAADAAVLAGPAARAAARAAVVVGAVAAARGLLQRVLHGALHLRGGSASSRSGSVTALGAAEGAGASAPCEPVGVDLMSKQAQAGFACRSYLLGRPVAYTAPHIRVPQHRTAHLP